MITFDSDRSKKRIWFGRKQLNILKGLDLPAGMKRWDGFTFKAWQQDDIEGGHITAPMGVVVLRSTLAGTEVLVGDHWLSGFTFKAPLNVLFRDIDTVATSTLLMDNWPQEMADESGYINVPFIPMESLSPFGLIDGETVGPDTVFETDANPTPGLMPIGEAFWISSSGNLHVDLNSDGVADEPRYIAETVLSFYNTAARGIAGRKSFSVEQAETTWLPWRIFFSIPTEDGIRQLQHHTAYYEEAPTGSDVVCGTVFEAGLTKLLFYEYRASTMWGPVPSGLKVLFFDFTLNTSMSPLGGYGFANDVNDPVTLLHACNVTNTNPWTSSCPSAAWFTSNPTQIKWKLFYSIYNGTTNSCISSDQFIPLLDSLADVPVDLGGGSVNWNNARRMLQQLFPWPNNDFCCPNDSAMFHGLDDNIYTWTRKYGAVKFTRTGLFAATVSVPSIVTDNVGVRPEIYFAGSYQFPDDETYPVHNYYLCICRDVEDNSLPGVCIGNPFSGEWNTGWTAVTLFTEELLNNRFNVNLDPEEPTVTVEWRLLHVRPVEISPLAVTFLGIVEVSLNGVAKNYVCLYREDVWEVLYEVPGDVTGAEQWSISLFGTGQMVNDIQDFLSPPHVLPQMPVGPYDKFAIGVP